MLGLAMMTIVAAQAPSCAALHDLIGDGHICVQTPAGLVVADSRERADYLAGLAVVGERRFQARFRVTVPSYAVVEMVGQSVDPRIDAALQAQGVKWRLPWLSESATSAAYRASIERAVRAKAQAMGLGAEQTAILVQSALAQQADKFTPTALRDKEASALPHELGHGWLTKAFWPKAVAGSSDHYGGPAPDWLDETAAILMEDDTLANSRRSRFTAIYRGPNAAARAELIDLSSFLSGGHPALPKIDLAGATAGVRVLTGAEAAGIVAAASGFYLQARVFADYVLMRSGQPDAFRSTADAFAGGRTLADWLASDGARLHLPTTVTAVQADWEAWLRSRDATLPTPETAAARTGVGRMEK